MEEKLMEERLQEEKKKFQKTKIDRYYLPYCDWDALRNIESPHERYARFTGRNDFKGYTPTENFEYTIARQSAALRLRDVVDQSNLTSSEFATNYGLDKGLTHKILNGKREFSLVPEKTEKVAHEFMGISEHNLYFGEDIPFVLPMTLNPIAARLDTLTSTNLDSVSQLLSDALKEQEDNRNQKRRFIELVKIRLQYLMYSLGEIPSRPLGAQMPMQLRTIMPFIFEAREDYEPKFGVLMYIALSSGIPLDFFCCNHYANWCDMYYTAGKKTIKIENKQIKMIIEKITNLDSLNNPAMVELYRYLLKSTAKRKD